MLVQVAQHDDDLARALRAAAAAAGGHRLPEFPCALGGATSPAGAEPGEGTQQPLGRLAVLPARRRDDPATRHRVEAHGVALCLREQRQGCGEGPRAVELGHVRAGVGVAHGARSHRG